MVPILYENSDFLIVNKPINIDFHGELGLLSRLREQSSQLYGVHRLDKATSGLMVFAKTKDILIKRVRDKAKNIDNKMLVVFSLDI